MKDELYGLENKEEVTLRCLDCGTPLINLVLTENNTNRLSRGLDTVKQRFKVIDCYKCGGSSPESKVLEGSVVLGTFKDKLKVVDEDAIVEEASLPFGRGKPKDVTLLTIIKVRENG